MQVTKAPVVMQFAHNYWSCIPLNALLVPSMQLTQLFLSTHATWEHALMQYSAFIITWQHVSFLPKPQPHTISP